MDNIYTRRKNKKNSLKRLLLLAIFLCIIAVMPVIYGPFFKVDDIQVRGNKDIPTATIKKYLEYFYGQNILMIEKEAINNAITESLPVKEVNVSCKLPRRIIVTIKERDVAAAIPFLNSFALIDDEGIVVKIMPNFENLSIPIITGLKISHAEVAKSPIIETSPEAYDKLKELLQVIKDFSSELSEINISDEDDVIFYLYTLDGYQIVLRECSQQKIILLMKILQDLRENGRGKGLLDMTNVTPFFKQFEGDWEGEI